MNVALFLARRLTLGSEGRKSSPAIRVAVTAVALSVAVMTASISIVLGFKREIRDKVVGFNSHITLYADTFEPTESNLVTLTPTLSAFLDSKPYITDFALDVSIPAIMKTPDNFKGVYLKSLDSATLRNFLASNIEEGKLPDYSRKGTEEDVVISRIAANQLGLKAGDRIDTYFMSGAIRVRRLRVAAIFNSHFDSYDDVYIYGNLPLIQNLGEISSSEGTSLSIAVDDFNNIQQYSDDLQNSLKDALASGLLYRHYTVNNALNQGLAYFHWLTMLDTNVIVILVLMTFVACMTLISGMLILILDKKRLIGLLRSMGASIGRVRHIFIYMAIRVAFYGLLIGNSLVAILLYAQRKWHFLRLDPDSYYIDYVPVEINWAAFIVLNVATVTVIYLCLIIPSWFAARISPAETMRNE